jgi:RNA polymerase sigma factor (sigma-70 family)
MLARRAQASWRAMDTLFTVGTLGGSTDGELLDRFLSSRDQEGHEAFRILVERHGPMVHGLCRSLVTDPHEAEDAFQATFLILVQKADSMRSQATLGPWLYAVASRVARRVRIRASCRRKREVHAVAEIASPEGPPSEGQGTEQVILEEIARLPSSFRGPVVLCCIQGLSYDLAAQRLGVTEPTLRGRLHRARRRLAARLGRRGIDSPAILLAIEPSRFGLSAPAQAFVETTVQLALKWSSLSILVVRASGIPESVVSLVSEANNPIVFPLGKWSGLVALFGAGIVGTVVLARQEVKHGVDISSGPLARSVASPPEKSSTPRQQAQKSDALTPRQQCEALLAEHEGRLKSIQTLKCVIDSRISRDGGKSWKESVTWKVSKSGLKERVHRTTHGFFSQSGSFDEIKPPGGEADILFTPEGLWSMAGYDPLHPPQELVTIRQELVCKDRISGLIRPAEPWGACGYRGSLAADYVLFLLPDVRYSLRDLLDDKANATVRPVERRDPEGHLVWDLELLTPDRARSVVVTLSPRHGYSILEERSGASGAHEKRTTRVVEYHEPAPGLYLAKTIQCRMSQDPLLIAETIIHDLEINAPIPETDFVFRFPRGIGVTDFGKNLHYLWGSGVPALTFKTLDEYNHWRRQQLDKDRGRVIE